MFLQAKIGSNFFSQMRCSHDVLSSINIIPCESSINEPGK